MFKNTLRIVSFLLISTMQFMSTRASDAPYTEFLGEYIFWLLSGEFSIQLPELGTPKTSVQSQRIPTQQEQERKCLMASYLASLLNSNPKNAQKLLRGLLQYILLDGYKKLMCDSSITSLLYSYINAIYFSYYFDFPYYLIDQPGNSLEEQLEHTLNGLDQEFTERFAAQHISSFEFFKHTFIRLLYILQNLSALSSPIIELLNNPSDNSLEQEIEKRFQDAYTSARAQNALADALKKPFI